MSDTLAFANEIEVIFNYFGRDQRVDRKQNMFTPCEMLGPQPSEEGESNMQRPAPLELAVRVTSSNVQVELTYSKISNHASRLRIWMDDTAQLLVSTVKELAVWPSRGLHMSKRPRDCYTAGAPLTQEAASMENLALPNFTTQLLLSFPGFRLYALCMIVLVLKMFAVGFYTGVARTKAKVNTNPEDAKTFGTQLVDADPPEVVRVLKAHRNDLENIPAFLFVALVAVLLNAHPMGLRICLVLFTSVRVVYTIAYLRAMQPWRTLLYGLGLLSTLALMVMIVLRILP